MTDDRTEVDAFIDGIEPSVMRDGQHLREVAAARTALDEADSRLRAAVDAAHDAGDSWTMIGLVLGISRQVAYRTFAHLGAIGSGSGQAAIDMRECPCS